MFLDPCVVCAVFAVSLSWVSAMRAASPVQIPTGTGRRKPRREPPFNAGQCICHSHKACIF